MTRSEILTVAKPILFNTEMVRAILDECKTATRRVIKPQPCEGRGPTRFIRWFQQDFYTTLARFGDDVSVAMCDRRSPYRPGDILYVRETWTKQNREYYYRADFERDFLSPCETLSGRYPSECTYYPGCVGCTRRSQRIIWRPSIHMPKEAARLFLRITSVRVERLREMVLADVLMEGIQETDCYEETWNYWHETWNSTIKPADLPIYGWEANPFVWVIIFERVDL